MSDALMQRLEEDFQQRHRAIVKMMREQGRQDLVKEFEEGMRAVRNGTATAGSVWRSISPKQRALLRTMETKPLLVRNTKAGTEYDAWFGHKVQRYVCNIRTCRPLCARELIHVDGPATDPEERFTLTERGLFVIVHGPRNAHRLGPWLES